MLSRTSPWTLAESSAPPRFNTGSIGESSCDDLEPSKTDAGPSRSESPGRKGSAKIAHRSVSISPAAHETKARQLLDSPMWNNV